MAVWTLNTAEWAPASASQSQERRRHEEELEANNGVFYRATLTAVPAPESIAADKGIRRAADKVWWGAEGLAAAVSMLYAGHGLCLAGRPAAAA